MAEIWSALIVTPCIYSSTYIGNVITKFSTFTCDTLLYFERLKGWKKCDYNTAVEAIWPCEVSDIFVQE